MRLSPWPATHVTDAAARPRAAARRWPATCRTAAAPTDAQIDPSWVAPRSRRSAPGPRSRFPSRKASRSRSRPGPAELQAPTASAAPPKAAARRTGRARTARMMRESGIGVTEGGDATRRRRLRPTPSSGPRSRRRPQRARQAATVGDLVPPGAHRDLRGHPDRVRDRELQYGEGQLPAVRYERSHGHGDRRGRRARVRARLLRRPAGTPAAQVPEATRRRSRLVGVRRPFRAVAHLDVALLRERPVPERQVGAAHPREAPRRDLAERAAPEPVVDGVLEQAPIARERLDRRGDGGLEQSGEPDRGALRRVPFEDLAVDRAAEREEPHLGRVAHALEEAAGRDPLDAHDVSVPLGQPPGIRDHLPDGLGRGVDDHVELGPGHLGLDVPDVQPRHHTTVAGRIPTRAASDGSTPASRAIRVADPPPEASADTTPTCPWPRIMVPIIARARHDDGRSTCKATAGAREGAASASVSDGATAYAPPPSIAHRTGSTIGPSPVPSARAPSPLSPRPSRIRSGTPANGDSPARVARKRSTPSTASPQSPQALATRPDSRIAVRSSRSSAKTRPGGVQASGTWCASTA